MIGEEVRRCREELGLTGAQLAERAGMAPSAVSQIETGKRSPSSNSVVKLAEALSVEVGDLFPKAQAPLPLEIEEQGGADKLVTEPEPHYNAFEVLGRLLASNWQDELEEWKEKIPTGTTPCSFDFGRLVEWVIGICGTKRTYEALAIDAYNPPGIELQDTLRLMDSAKVEALQKVLEVFRPAKEYAEFRKIVEENDLEATLSSAKIDG